MGWKQKSALIILGVVGTGLAETSLAQAALSASADLTLLATNTSGSASVYSYAITLHDTGSTTIGTLWYAWIPGQDFMSTSPTNIQSPAGWTSTITGGNPGNGYAIQWVATGAAFDATAGSTLSGFAFNSLDTPAMLAGNSAFYPTTPVATTFVYSGTPFSDGGYRFLVTSVVPEPGFAMIFAAPLTGLLLRRRARAV